MPVHNIVILAFRQKLARLARLESNRFAQRPSRGVAVISGVADAHENPVLDVGHAVAPLQARKVGIAPIVMRLQRSARGVVRRIIPMRAVLHAPKPAPVYVHKAVFFVLQPIDFVYRAPPPQRRTPAARHQRQTAVKPSERPIHARIVEDVFQNGVRRLRHRR